MEAWRNSFMDAPAALKTKASFDAVLEACNIPDLVPLNFVIAMSDWMNKAVYDNLFIDIVNSVTPELHDAAVCIVQTYQGVSL